MFDYIYKKATISSNAVSSISRSLFEESFTRGGGQIPRKEACYFKNQGKFEDWEHFLVENPSKVLLKGSISFSSLKFKCVKSKHI